MASALLWRGGGPRLRGARSHFPLQVTHWGFRGTASRIPSLPQSPVLRPHGAQDLCRSGHFQSHPFYSAVPCLEFAFEDQILGDSRSAWARGDKAIRRNVGWQETEELSPGLGGERRPPAGRCFPELPLLEALRLPSSLSRVPRVAVTNDPKLSNLKKQALILSQFLRPDVQNQVSTGSCSL